MTPKTHLSTFRVFPNGAQMVVFRYISEYLITNFQICWTGPPFRASLVFRDVQRGPRCTSFSGSTVLLENDSGRYVSLTFQQSAYKLVRSYVPAAMLSSAAKSMPIFAQACQNSTSVILRAHPKRTVNRIQYRQLTATVPHR